MSASLLWTICSFIVAMSAAAVGWWWVENRERRMPVRRPSDAEMAEIRRTRTPGEWR